LFATRSLFAPPNTLLHREAAALASMLTKQAAQTAIQANVVTTTNAQELQSSLHISLSTPGAQGGGGKGCINPPLARRLAWTGGCPALRQAALSCQNVSIAVIRGSSLSQSAAGMSGHPLAPPEAGCCLPVHVLDEGGVLEQFGTPSDLPAPDVSNIISFALLDGPWLMADTPPSYDAAVKAGGGAAAPPRLVPDAAGIRAAYTEAEGAHAAWVQSLSPLVQAGVCLVLSPCPVGQTALSAAQACGVALLQLVQPEVFAGVRDTFGLRVISQLRHLASPPAHCVGRAGASLQRRSAPLLRFDCGAAHGVASDTTDHMTSSESAAAGLGAARITDVLGATGGSAAAAAASVEHRPAREQQAIAAVARSMRQDGSMLRPADVLSATQQVGAIRYARKQRTLNTKLSQLFVFLHPAENSHVPPPVSVMVQAVSAHSAAMAAESWRCSWRHAGLCLSAGVVPCLACTCQAVAEQLTQIAQEIMKHEGADVAVQRATLLPVSAAVRARASVLLGLAADGMRQLGSQACKRVNYGHIHTGVDAVSVGGMEHSLHSKCSRCTRIPVAAAALQGAIDSATDIAQLISTCVEVVHGP